MLATCRFGLESALTLIDGYQVLEKIFIKNNNLSALTQIATGNAVSIKPLSN
jgi:hypothetical protein